MWAESGVLRPRGNGWAVKGLPPAVPQGVHGANATACSANSPSTHSGVHRGVGWSPSRVPRHPLAMRASVGRAVHEMLSADQMSAAPAGQSLAAVHVQRTVEVATLAVDVDVERVEAGAA